MTKERERDLLARLLTVRAKHGLSTTYQVCMSFLVKHASDYRDVVEIEIPLDPSPDMETP